MAGVRYADLRGFSYDRADVTSRGLANAYAQTLGTVFTEAQKPYEVEIIVAEVGVDEAHDQLYRLTFDGSVGDEHGFLAMGGAAEAISTQLQEQWQPDLSLSDALQMAVAALAEHGGQGPRTLDDKQLEVAILDRTRPRRAFRRVIGEELKRLLNTE